MKERSWDYSPTSKGVLKDSGPWVWFIPKAWSAVADPTGPWRPPVRPHIPGPSPFSGDLAARIAFWTPLLHLTLGGLGWVRPDLGIKRWIEQKMPTDDPRLRVVRRWWGKDALTLVCRDVNWEVAEVAERVAKSTDSAYLPWQALADLVRAEEARCPDRPSGLHLSGHVGMQLLDEGLKAQRIVHGAPESMSTEAALLLETYDGWYRALARGGRDLPDRPDGRSWKVDVVVRPMGHLGTYRLSRVTGRWFAGRHRWHLLGWPGNAGLEELSLQ